LYTKSKIFLTPYS